VVRAVPEALAVLAVQVAQEALEVSAEPAVLDALVAPAELVVLAAALELRPVQAPLELVQVAALAHARAAVPLLRTRSVTAAHRRALALGPKREEDMAVVAAATTRAPAATEAARVWEGAE
jgi:hypothetical protein